MRPSREELLLHAKRLLALVDDGASDLADDVMHVPIAEYGDPDGFRREVDAIFRSRPMPVVFSAEIAQPGAYVSLDVVGVPLLVTRADDGVARAFVNTCRHRGARVVPAGCGHESRFACPYHAWSYDPKGALVRIPGERLFGEVDHGTRGLTPLPTEERHGAVFAVLDPNAPAIDVDTWLGQFGTELERLQLDRRHVAWTNTLTGPNWKICADGYTENYHFPFLHQKTISLNNLSNVVAHDTWGPFQRQFMPRRTIEQLRDDATAAALTDEEIAACWASVHYLFPSTMLSSAWGEWTFVSQIWPGSTADTSITRQVMLTTSPVDTPERKAIAAAQRESFYAIIDGDDYAVGRTIQAGLAAGGNTEFVLGRNEIGTQHFHRWVEALATRGHDTAEAPR